MLGMNPSKKGSPETGSVNLIGYGTKIAGDISSHGDVRIDGHLTGNIFTSGKFVLGPNGMVEGNITSCNADLSGEVKGQVIIEEMLSLKSSAKVNGDIITAKLHIEPGAQFNGSCNMGAKVKNMHQQVHQQVNAGTKTA